MHTVAAKEDDPRRFLHPETIARISRLDLRARQVVEGFISGMHRSPFFGHSVEFVQHRDYTPGDDIRHLDWKVWSKTDKFYIKQFEEETNLRCTLVVDVSNSMHYGSGALNKYNYGCTIAACLAYMLLRQQDSVGLITFDEDVRQVVPPRSQQTHIDAIVKAMDVSRPRDKTDIERILRRVAENMPRPRHDRADLRPAGGPRAAVPRSGDAAARPARRAGVPRPGRGRADIPLRRHDALRGHGGARRKSLCDPRALRDGYIEALEEYLVEVRRGCARKGIDYMLVHTGSTWTRCCPSSCTTAWRCTRRRRRWGRDDRRCSRT